MRHRPGPFGPSFATPAEGWQCIGQQASYAVGCSLHGTCRSCNWILHIQAYVALRIIIAKRHICITGPEFFKFKAEESRQGPLSFVCVGTAPASTSSKLALQQLFIRDRRLAIESAGCQHSSSHIVSFGQFVRESSMCSSHKSQSPSFVDSGRATHRRLG